MDHKNIFFSNFSYGLQCKNKIKAITLLAIRACEAPTDFEIFSTKWHPLEHTEFEISNTSPGNGTYMEGVEGSNDPGGPGSPGGLGGFWRSGRSGRSWSCYFSFIFGE